MADPLSEEEIRQFLGAIEDGLVTITPTAEPQDIDAGDVAYRASNGRRIVVFNDGNEWDYIDSIESDDDRRATFDDIDRRRDLADYQPSGEVAWSRYRIPGYCRFRCVACGRGYSYRKDGVYRCPDCRG